MRTVILYRALIKDHYPVHPSECRQSVRNEYDGLFSKVLPEIAEDALFAS